jgi:hypothetical protein
MSIRQLASDEAGSIGPRAQRELFEIAQLLETGKTAIAAWPIGFGNFSFNEATR